MKGKLKYFLFLVLFLMNGCAIHLEVGKSLGIEKEKYVEKGLASWYGPGFYGKKTASGEVYTGKELTAAHKSLPFGTKVKVTRVDNGKSVIVRINDRGPFQKGYIIDLSKAAAKEIGLSTSTEVEIQVVE